MKKLVNIILLIIIIVAFSACTSKSASEPQVTESQSIKTVLKVEGMTCSSCVRTVRNAVTALDGVTNVDINLRSGNTTIVHDSSLDIETIKHAIEEKGFIIQ